jgi:hypothetical protein
MGLLAFFATIRVAILAACFWLFLTYADGWVYALIGGA